jgi:hypothetical protein
MKILDENESGASCLEKSVLIDKYFKQIKIT